MILELLTRISTVFDIRSIEVLVADRLRPEGNINGRTIIFVGAKYDYEDKSRGLSYEHYQFYMTLITMGYKVIYFPYDQFKKEYGARKMSLMLREAVYYFNPELLVYFHFADWIDHDVLREISDELPTKTIILLADDFLRYQESRPVWELFNVVVTMDPVAYEKRKKEGFNNVFLSRWAINHHLYRNLNLKKIYDVIFVGQCYGQRPEMIQRLQEQGVKVLTFGHGWRGSGRVSQSNMIKLYNQSKIVFNSYLTSHDTIRMNARDFEALGCGSLPITDDVDELREFFILGKEIVTYKNLNEAAENIKYYLSHDAERNDIAQAGYQRVINEHTYEKRFQEIFKFADQVKGNRPVAY